MQIFLAPRSNETSHKNFLSTIEYPLHSGPVQDLVKVRNVDVIIEQTEINLGLPFSEFRDECGRFCDAVLSLAPAPELAQTI